MDETVIQLASDNDIVEVASIHKQQFSTHFLGRYSEQLLAAYYKALLGNSIFLVSKYNGKVNGFVVGGLASNLSYAKREFLIQNKLLYIKETILRPNTYWDVLKRLKPVISSMYKPIQLNNDDSIWILSIAVAKGFMGKGIAQKLCTEFEKSIELATEYGLYVRCDNKRALHFYRKMGFYITKQVDKEFCLIKQIRTEQSQ